MRKTDEDGATLGQHLMRKKKSFFFSLPVSHHPFSTSQNEARRTTKTKTVYFSLFTPTTGSHPKGAFNLIKNPEISSDDEWDSIFLNFRKSKEENIERNTEISKYAILGFPVT